MFVILMMPGNVYLKPIKLTYNKLSHLLPTVHWEVCMAYHLYSYTKLMLLPPYRFNKPTCSLRKKFDHKFDQQNMNYVTKIIPLDSH
jgi:hypothetical protein